MNAHIIFEEYLNSVKKAEKQKKSIFVLSAKTQERLKIYVENVIQYLEETTHSLADIAYTSQVAREPMNERLAVIAETKEELIVKLNRFLEGNVDGVFTSTTESRIWNYSKNKGIEADCLREHIKKQDYKAVVNYYLSGENIEWEGLYNKKKFSRVDFPKYPFKKEHHWIENPKEGEALQLELVKKRNEKMVENKNGHTAEKKVNHDIEPPYIVCQSKWFEEAIPNTPMVMKNCMVIVGTDASIVNKVKNEVKTSGPVITVLAGDAFRKTDELIYYIRIMNEEDYILLWQDLKQRDLKPDFIINTISLNWNGQPFDIIYPVFYLMKSMLQELKLNSTKFVYIVEQCGDISFAYNEAVSAFMKSVLLENNYCSGVSITLENVQTHLGKCLTELVCDDGQVFREVLYKDDNRYIRKLAEVELPTSGLKSLLKNQGVYVISGGFGGIGMQLAGYLLKNYSAKVVLFGRSPLSHENEKRINELKLLGGEVIYKQADVSNKEEVSVVIEETKARFTKIDGVFHLAGINRDKHIIRKNAEEIQKVLKAKIEGTLNLDRCTQDQSLDFFLLFSSITSVLGNVGQSDYAYANRFVDNFAGLRHAQVWKGKRHGHTCVINWPFWENGGMNIKEHILSKLRNQTGLGTISPSIGMDIFEKALAMKYLNIVALPGDIDKIRQTFKISRYPTGEDM